MRLLKFDGCVAILALLLGACRGASSDPTTSSSSEDSGPGTGSDAGSATGDETATTTGDSEGELCLEGSPKTWCFEVASNGVGGQFADFDGDGRTDFVMLGPSAGQMTGYHALEGEPGSYESIWALQFDFTYTTILRVLDGGPGGPHRFLVSSGNDPNGAVSLYELSGLDEPSLLQKYVDDREWRMGRMLAAFVDADDELDVVALAEGEQYLRVWLGDGSGGFAPQPEVELVEDVYTFFAGADAADVDGDGAMDLVVDDVTPSGPTVYFGDGTGLFPETSVIDGYSLGNIYARDLDGDARVDVLFETGSGFAIAFSEGRTFRLEVRQLGVEPFFPMGEGFSFLPVDLDEDGTIELLGYHDDLVEGDFENGTYETRMYVLSEPSAEGFDAEASAALDEDCSPQATEGFLPQGPLELDGDGHPDVVVEWSKSCPGQEDVYDVLGVMFRP